MARCDPPGSPFCSPEPDAALLPPPAAAAGAAAGTGAGAGGDAYGIRLPVQPPGPPVAVSVDVDPGMGSSLLVGYGAPASDGGAAVLAYRLEWSAQPDFPPAATGRVDVPCAPAAPRHVVAVTTYNAAAPGRGGLTTGTFQLQVSHGSQTFTTAPLRWDAQAAAADERPDSGSRVFCEAVSQDPPTSAPVACTGALPAGAAAFTPDAPGSLQSALRALPFSGGVDADVTVAPAFGGGGGGERTWLVTFATGGADWAVAPLAFASLANASSGQPGGVNVSVVQAGVAPSSLSCTSTQRLGGLAQGVPYHVRVSAYNAEGYSLPAGGLNPRGRPAQAPMRVPGRPTSVALTVKSGSELRVTWSPPSDTGGDAVTSYVVEYGPALLGGAAAPGGGLANASPSPSSSTVEVTYLPDAGPYSRVLGGLPMGQPVFVRVFAVNSQGAGDGQQPTPTSERPRQLPKAPLGVRLEVTSDTMLTVGYGPPDNDGGDAVVAFRVDWDVDPYWESNARLPHRGSVVVPAAGHLRTTLTSLNPGTQYYVRVAAGNRVGFGLPSVDTPAGRAPLRQVPGRPFDVHGSPSAAYCRAVRLQFSPPVVPHHGLYCSGGGTGNRSAPGPCPLGMGWGRQADGGSRVAAYEVQYATSPSFADAQRVTYAVDAGGGGADDPVDFSVGPSAGGGANLQPGQTYFLRVAARNGQGTGPFCGRAGVNCDGPPIAVQPSPAC